MGAPAPIPRRVGRLLPTLVVAPLVLIAAVLTLPAAAAAQQPTPPAFIEQNLFFNSAKLFDQSVADIEGDGDLDLFSTNHKYRGSLLAGDGRGGFGDALDTTGLTATPDIPGFDELFAEPRIATKGLYLWVDRDGFTHLRTRGLGTDPSLPKERVKGEIRFLGREAKVKRSIGVRSTVSLNRNSRPPSGVVSFDAGPEAELVIRAKFMDLPFEVEIDEDFKRSRILLGPRLSHPDENEFAVDLGDRHGVGWADLNADGELDAYIANGGNRGAIRRFGALAEDELFWGRGDGRFEEGIADAGITKGFCRGRQVELVDYDSDNDLDIFVGCEGTHPLLFMQRKPGRFGSRSHELTQIGVRADLYRWIDLERDGIPELIAVSRRKIKLYERSPVTGEFVRGQRLRAPDQGKIVDTIAVADIDGDLDVDVFVGSRGGNSLLLNRSGTLELVDPARKGLPRRGTVAASFLDYDNDAVVDFHAVPQGLFAGLRRGRYERLGSVRVGGRARWAASSWLDFDSDGDRDLVSVLKRRGNKLRKRTYVNHTEGGNWLEVDLVGPVGNAEAIGARVVVNSVDGRQAAWVGQSEGSRYSQGHYRLYFGTRRETRVNSVRVFWPDGTETGMRNVDTNQRLTIEYPR